jgi:hypothetical protein
MLLFSISSYIADDIAGASSTFLPAAFLAGAATGAALGLDAAAITSSLRIRPTGPLPTIPSREMPASFAVILARGLAKILSPDALAAGALDDVAATVSYAASYYTGAADAAPGT